MNYLKKYYKKVKEDYAKPYKYLTKQERDNFRESDDYKEYVAEMEMAEERIRQEIQRKIAINLTAAAQDVSIDDDIPVFANASPFQKFVSEALTLIPDNDVYKVNVFDYVKTEDRDLFLDILKTGCYVGNVQIVIDEINEMSRQTSLSPKEVLKVCGQARLINSVIDSKS